MEAALSFHHSSYFFLLFLLLLLKSCSAFHPKLLNASIISTSAVSNSNWSPAVATWYGSPNGDGSEGGACGYGPTVGQAPFNSMISAGGNSLFQSGNGCGECYQVKCTGNAACSGNPVTVTITDSCPGCSESVHFDLSGTAFGAMAKSGQADQLRNAGFIQIQYLRMKCNYRGWEINFHVDAGSNPYYFATVIEYEDEGIAAVDLQEAGGNAWVSMQQSWGAIWKLNWGTQLKAPLSMRIKSSESGNTIVARDVIPANWQPGKTYVSKVNFMS
ncbi:hypothetical protein SLE2022_026110 [Rubroshorea leprosula]